MKRLLIFLILQMYCFSLFANELQKSFYDWSVFKINKNNKTICYMAALPLKNEGNILQTAESFFLVTKIQEDADEISLSIGAPFGKNASIELSTANKKYSLFPYQVLAWANNRTDDIDIIKDLQQQADFKITAILEDGKNIVQTYSLIGFVDGYNFLKTTCR